MDLSEPAIAAAEDLCAFIDASPSPFHAVAEMARRLRDGGFTELDEVDRWRLAPGRTVFVTRDSGSIIAVRIGTDAPAAAGFRLVGAHTDSPTFRVRPNPDVSAHGYGQIGVEVYGGPLHYTWLDRDLTLAGRLVVHRPGDEAPVAGLVHLPGAPLRIPSLAIHLDRELYDKGLQLNPQHHLKPMYAAVEDAGGLEALLAGTVAGAPDVELLAADLVLADTQPSALGGLDRQFVLAPRQDNLVSCHAALVALLAAEETPQTQAIVCNDHEEVGSSSHEGAAGSFLADVLARLVAATGDDDPQALGQALARSTLVSADGAHAVHPNHADRHDAQHRPVLGGGPVVKVHASQAYATDARTAAWFERCCADVDVPVQRFTNRADSRSGSTIGPLTATRLGVATVDVGNPMLSMHSVREQTATADVLHLSRALERHLVA